MQYLSMYYETLAFPISLVLMTVGVCWLIHEVMEDDIEEIEETDLKSL